MIECAACLPDIHPLLGFYQKNPHLLFIGSTAKKEKRRETKQREGKRKEKKKNIKYIYTISQTLFQNMTLFGQWYKLKLTRNFYIVLLSWCGCQLFLPRAFLSFLPGMQKEVLQRWRMLSWNHEVTMRLKEQKDKIRPGWGQDVDDIMPQHQLCLPMSRLNIWEKDTLVCYMQLNIYHP